MSKKTMFKLGALALFVLWLIFGDAAFKDKAVVVLGVVVVYNAVSRVMGQEALKKEAAQGMVNLYAENSFKPDYEHFHADGNQVSGVAISKDDPRIVLATAGVPARLFSRRDVLSVGSEAGKEKDVQFKAVSFTGAGDKVVNTDVYVVDVSVKDLDHPRYKLYFQNLDQMRQWENRLAAWLDMHAAA